ncbi:MAG: DUF1697 domain-containing protein [Rhodomicrobiaceae bacterium]
MTTRIALLRAINVGGRGKIAMADLRALFADLGFAGARTLLQTGNVVFQSDALTGGKLEAMLEEAIAARLKHQTDVLVRSADEWDRIIKANPFPDEAADDPSHLLVMPLKHAPGRQALKDLNAAIKGREVVRAEGAQLYITYPEGIGRSKLTIALIEKRLGTRGTARNWNTVLKIADLMRTR